MSAMRFVSQINRATEINGPYGEINIIILL